MTVEVRLAQEGDKYVAWGYEVTSPLAASTHYGTRARLLDDHFLLEEREGGKFASGVSWEAFGIVNRNMTQEADKRIFEKARQSARKSLEDLTPKLIEDLGEPKPEHNETNLKKYSQLPDTERQKYDAMSIGELNLGVRAANCLDSANINTVGQLAQTTDHKLLNIRSFGRTCLRAVKKRLKDLGLDTGM